ncbi:MAG: alcohol dehydrogenase catalytic domain-containing protein [Desulfobacterales bacterium]|nr:MAG: alcohol dehydrogenase catalytic domain-containing protein [Desulfobacterales bacterium]
MLAVIKNPSEVGISLEDTSIPEFSPWEVLLKVKAVGICGSDLRIFKYADPNRRGNYIPGHEVSGEVVEMGEKVHGFKKGDRVATEICIGCAICRYCRKGLVNLCENLNEIGVTMNGGMAEYVAVPARNVHRIPENLSFEEATFADPLACSIRGLELAGIKPFSWVAILGPGAIGLLATKVAKDIRRSNVIVTGTNDNRLELAKEFGAEHTFNIRNSDPTEEILEITNGGVDYAFEAAGNPNALQQAIDITRKNGSIVIMTVHKKIQIDVEPVIRNELTLIGSICYNYKEFDQAVDLLAKKKLDVKPLIGHTFPLKEAAQAFDFCFSRKGVKIILLP